MTCTTGTPAPGQIVALNFSGSGTKTIETPTLVQAWDASTVSVYIMSGTVNKSGTIGSATITGTPGQPNTPILTKTLIGTGVGNIPVSLTGCTGGGCTDDLGVTYSGSFLGSPTASFLEYIGGAPTPGCTGTCDTFPVVDCGGFTTVVAVTPGTVPTFLNNGGCGGNAAAYNLVIQWEGTACVVPSPPATPPSGEAPTPGGSSGSNSPAAYAPATPNNPAPSNNEAPSVTGGNAPPIRYAPTPANAAPPVQFVLGCSDCDLCPEDCVPFLPPALPQYPPLFVFLPDGSYSPVSWNGYVLPLSDVGTVEIGTAYPTLYSSPVLASGMFNSRKRLKHAYLQFDNETGLEVHTDRTTNKTALYGKAQFELDTNIYISYLNEGTNEPIVDTYRYDSLRFPDALYSNHFSPKQIDERYTLFKEPLLGTSYAYQLGVYSLDTATWRLVGWQISAKMKGDTIGEFNE